MHTSFTDSDTLGRFTPPSYANWLAKLRDQFSVPDDFLLADAIFSFENAFEKTPQEAYEAFDILVSAEA